MITDRRRDDARLPIVVQASQAQEKNTAADAVLPKDQLPEVLIGGDENGVRLSGAGQYVFVRSGWRVFGNIVDIMPVLA